MKSLRVLTHVLLVSAALAASVTARADVITTSVTSADRIQLGRLSRNGVPQDFAGDEPFSGVINPTTQYRYATFAVNVGSTNFVSITCDTPDGNEFCSAYQTSYRPDSDHTANLGFQTNWLGDAGGSNFTFDNAHPFEDGGFMDVVAALNSTIIIVVNTTAANFVGVGSLFTLSVQGSSDADFDNLQDLAISRVPEPSTVLLLLAPLGLLAVMRRRRVTTTGSAASFA
jgi:hypothetical protein